MSRRPRPKTPGELFALVGAPHPSPKLGDSLDDFVRDVARWLIICAGRASFKSTTAGRALVFGAVVEHVDHEAEALAGTVLPYTAIAPTQEQAREVARSCIAHLEMLAPLGVEFVVRGENDGLTEIEIVAPRTRTTAVIRIATADGRTLRGPGSPLIVATEAGFFPADGPASLASVLQATTPRTFGQFKRGRVIVESSKGPPSGRFYEMVTRPPPSAMLVEGATWDFNPKMDEAACRAAAPDPIVFDQEFASTRWGAAGETFLDHDAVKACVDAAIAGDDDFERCAIGLDYAAIHDGAAIVAASAKLDAVDGDAPRRRVIVRCVRAMQGSRTRPLLVADFVGAALKVARAHRARRVRADAHCAPEIEQRVREAGLTFERVPMDSESQTKRWLSLRELINARRIVLPDEPELVRQLAELRATQLSSGSLRVEGRRDDLADALALAAEEAMSRAFPTSGGEVIRIKRPLFFFPGEGLRGGEVSYARRMPNGDLVPIDPPIDSPGFEQWARARLAEGITTPSIERWRRSRGDT
ncbi:MAG: hypothetical protein ACHREM_29160 [Polyangiales bacterium]